MKRFIVSLMALVGFILTSSAATANEPADEEAADATLRIGEDLPLIPGMAERGWQAHVDAGVDPELIDPSNVRSEAYAFGNQWGPAPSVMTRGGLTIRRREMVVLASITSAKARSDLQFRAVGPHVGLSEREMEEVNFITCIYAGFPRCAGAMSFYYGSLDPERLHGADAQQPLPPLAPPLTDPENLVESDPQPFAGQVERGRQLGELSGMTDLEKIYPELKGSGFVEFTNTYGPTQSVYGRGGLSFHDREVVVIATIASVGNQEDLDWHIRDVALKAGLTEREIQEIILTTCYFAGWSRCTGAMVRFRRVMNGPNEWPAERRGLAPIPQ